jgi:hypothetical protein
MVQPALTFSLAPAWKVFGLDTNFRVWQVLEVSSELMRVEFIVKMLVVVVVVTFFELLERCFDMRQKATAFISF